MKKESVDLFVNILFESLNYNWLWMKLILIYVTPNFTVEYPNQWMDLML